MELDKLLRRRRNVYGFLPREVPEAVLRKILENARHVPSAGFTQDFDLVVIRDDATKKKLGEAARQTEYEELEGVIPNFVEDAPVIVVPCGNKTRFEAKYGTPAEANSRIPWWLTDAAFSSFCLTLSAFQEGLTASFLGAIDDRQVATALHLPRDGSVIPLAIIPVGYKHPKETFPAKQKARTQRRPFDQQIHWDNW
jgi:nitroreductase